MSVSATPWIERAERWGRWLETALVTLILSGLILLASTQILLRNVFSSGLEWGDELVRLLVLWLVLVGAVAASREDKQIKIDLLSRALSGRFKVVARVTTNFFTAAVTGLLAWHSWRFVQESRLYGDTLLTDVPAWILQLILPVGFLLICYRYLLRVLRDLAGERQ